MKYKNKKVNFTVLKIRKIPDLEKITSVAVVAFNENREILAVELKRKGVDLPGGHIEKGDCDIYETVKREAKEEAGAELNNDLKISAIIKSDYYKLPTYMIILTGTVKRLCNFAKNKESVARRFMKPKDFIGKYGGDKKIIKEIIDRSVAIINL